MKKVMRIKKDKKVEFLQWVIDGGITTCISFRDAMDISKIPLESITSIIHALHMKGYIIEVVEL